MARVKLAGLDPTGHPRLYISAAVAATARAARHWVSLTGRNLDGTGEAGARCRHA